MYRAKILIFQGGISLIASLMLFSYGCGHTPITPTMIPGLVNIRVAGQRTPEYDVPGDSHKWLLDRMASWALQNDVVVVYSSDLEPKHFGRIHCELLSCIITLNSNHTINSQASTILHELAHLLVPNPDRDTWEILAESVAMLTASELGLDTTNQSLDYLGLYPQAIRDRVIPYYSKEINASVEVLVAVGKQPR